ncbi:DoxX family protein [Georgenia sp. Z1491]|uniref:DoxX family protein n=1 Tax=Georgenia sp. Z1491 TaxID=3416707 RepID=UPI003CE6EDA9
MATTTAGTRSATIYQDDIIKSSSARVFLGLSRIGIGLYFLWAFLDKTFGLGFATESANSWINGGTPAQGYINGVAVNGPLGGFFELFANPFGDILFMAGLLGIGVALVSGAGLKIAAVSGALLLLFMYLAQPPFAVDAASNPILDSHVLEGFLVVIPALTLSGDTLGIGKWWGGIVGNGWLR